MLRKMTKHPAEGVLVIVTLTVVLWLTIGLASSTMGDPGDTIAAGIDTWSTPNNRSTYLDVHFPAGYFCNGESAALTRRIYFKGKPIATQPAGVLGPADTIIERNEAQFVDNVASTEITILALSLTSRYRFGVRCPSGTYESWTTNLTLDGEQPAGTITISRPNSSTEGGTFDSSFTVNAQLNFVSTTGLTAGPLPDTAVISSTGSHWTHEPGDTAVTYTGTVWVDVDGDGHGDVSTPGNSNFAPGWSLTGCANPPCKKKSEHGGPHPETWPSCSPSCIVTSTGTGSGSGSGN